jgi:predicted nucleotidyltransferase
VTLKLDEDQAREIARLRERTPGARCAVIGAVAIGHHVPLPRQTRDVDLVIELGGEELTQLLTGLAWKPDPRHLQRWTGRGNFVADVLPATPTSVAAGRRAPDGKDIAMSFAGFDLLFEHATEIQIPGQNAKVYVASLGTLVVLKVAAWLDRPYDRYKDLNDIGTILASALPEDDARRWDIPIPGDFEDQSPRFVGQQVGQIASPEHRLLVDEFVSALVREQSPWVSHVAKGMGLSPHDPGERVRKALVAFGLGLDEG